MDLYRVFSFRFFIAITGVFLCYLLSIYLQEYFGPNNNIFTLFIMSVDSFLFLLSLVFFTLSFSSVFAEDIENNFIFQEVIRGKLSKYVISKNLIIVISTIIIALIGTILFILFLKTKNIPWVTEETLDNVQYMMEDNIFGKLFLSENYFLFYLLQTFQRGLFYSVISVLTAYISLYITNKVLVFSFPIIIFYLQNNIFFEVCDFFQIEPIASFYTMTYISLFQNKLVSFLFSSMIYFFVICLFTYLIYRRLNKKIFFQ